MTTLKAFAEGLGFSGDEEAIVRQAMTHSSYAHDHPQYQDNERLEFLGDSVLSLLCSRSLFVKFPRLREGELSRLRASLVCEATLAGIAKKHDLHRHLLLGRSAAGSGGAERPSILAGCTESLLGAAYLIGGLPRAEQLFDRFYGDLLDKATETMAQADAKSALQELAPEAVQYTLVAQSGPDHDRTYRVQVEVQGKVMGVGEGRSKKQAEQAAALSALRKLR